MKPRHAATLALVGWYLMVPPMAAQLDSSCAIHDKTASASDIFGALFAWRPLGEINMIRCDALRHEVRYDAPVSDWSQAGSSETLAACEAQYNKDQKPLDNEKALSRNVAKMEFIDEGERPSETQLQLRAETIAI